MHPIREIERVSSVNKPPLRTRLCSADSVVLPSLGTEDRGPIAEMRFPSKAHLSHATRSKTHANDRNRPCSMDASS